MELYGKGVHAYFAREYLKAHDELTRAIEAGSNDPRAYYFRGLALLQLGRPEQAEDDFNRGAQLEVKDTSRYYNVARALERVQGRPRHMLEKYRLEARVASLIETQKYQRARYEEQQRDMEKLAREQAQQPKASVPSESPSKPPSPDMSEQTPEAPWQPPLQPVPGSLPTAKPRPPENDEDPLKPLENERRPSQPEMPVEREPELQPVVPAEPKPIPSPEAPAEEMPPPTPKETESFPGAPAAVPGEPGMEPGEPGAAPGEQASGGAATPGVEKKPTTVIGGFRRAFGNLLQGKNTP
jgi:hypothetical protein